MADNRQNGSILQYLTGFGRSLLVYGVQSKTEEIDVVGNELKSEARPGALPEGQNNPKVLSR